MYVELGSGLHHVDVLRRRELVTRKHVTFDETAFPLAEEGYVGVESINDSNDTFENITNGGSVEVANLQTEGTYESRPLMEQNNQNKVGNNDGITTLAG